MRSFACRTMRRRLTGRKLCLSSPSSLHVEVPFGVEVPFDVNALVPSLDWRRLAGSWFSCTRMSAPTTHHTIAKGHSQFLQVSTSTYVQAGVRTRAFEARGFGGRRSSLRCRLLPPAIAMWLAERTCGRENQASHQALLV